jgi:hypothetical protein
MLTAPYARPALAGPAPASTAPAGGVYVFDTALLPWQTTPEPGLRLKPVRYDNTAGEFLGLVAFDAGARSGLHQHQGVATSFVLAGGLTDYHGSLGLHEAGINLAGATHDAVAYQPTLLVSRLEGPVLYPPARAVVTGLHAGSRQVAFVNPAPDVPPEVNVAVDHVQRHATGVPGLQRQTVFDYAGTGTGTNTNNSSSSSSPHRFVQLHLRPGTVCPAWRATALTELWVRGGAVHINGQVAHAHCFVVIEPGAQVQLAAPFGALLLAWAEGPEAWQPSASAGGAFAGPPQPSLFGF